MADQKPRERRNDVGPTARTVGANVRRLRQEMGATQADLAARLKSNHHPIPVASIGRIESGDRRVEVDDLTALATSLGVSPLALLLPNTRSAQDEVEVTGWAKAPALDIWRWAIAGAPLAWKDQGEYDDESLYLTVRRSFPWWLDPGSPTGGDPTPRVVWDLMIARPEIGAPDGVDQAAP